MFSFSLKKNVTIPRTETPQILNEQLLLRKTTWETENRQNKSYPVA